MRRLSRSTHSSMRLVASTTVSSKSGGSSDCCADSSGCCRCRSSPLGCSSSSSSRKFGRSVLKRLRPESRWGVVSSSRADDDAEDGDGDAEREDNRCVESTDLVFIPSPLAEIPANAWSNGDETAQQAPSSAVV